MTNLLNNGSFEGPHTGTVFGTAPPGWFNVEGSADLNRVLLGSGDSGASDGDDWVWFGSNAGLSESFGQTLVGGALTTGQSYTFSMDVDPGYTGLPADPGPGNQLELQDQAGNVLATYDPPDWNAGYQTWTVTFVAPPESRALLYKRQAQLTQQFTRLTMPNWWSSVSHRVPS